MTIRFAFDWVDTAPSPDAEMRHTMAQLSVHVNGRIVTAVEDHSTGTRRDHVVVPLLSVANWIVGNWCHIWQEIPDATSDLASQKPGFEQRHNLAFAGDGFLFPMLIMVPSLNGVQLQWTRWQPRHARIAFVAEGKARVASGQLQTELATLVEAVLQRLHNFAQQPDSLATALQDAWDAIQALDPDEHAFCRAAALLGLDPFAIQHEAADAITDLWQHTEPVIREDLLASLDAATLPGAAAWLNRTQQELRDHQDVANENEWDAVRRGLPVLQPAKPWGQGYALARSLRHALNCGDGCFDFAATGQPAVRHRETAMPSSRIEGLVAATAPTCAIDGRKPEAAKRFTLARALGDYIGRSQAGPGLITSMDTARQAQSRAFAAELLAPAQSLRTRLAGQDANEDVISGLGHEFGVSSWVVHRQIRNHRLAALRPGCTCG